MFALEVAIKDGVSPPETIFLRRPQGLIGGSDYAHVFVEDLRNLGYQIRLVRQAGRRFSCKPIGAKEGVTIPPELDAVYDGDAEIDVGPVRFHITALDLDLLSREGEPLDRAGVRVMRRACSTPAPLYPAIVVHGNTGMAVSFSQDQPIYIGRSKFCGLRLDSADISARHARMGYENGSFWIEDLGSTNGTYLDQQQISGRVAVAAGRQIVIGREATIYGVTSADQAFSEPQEVAPEPERPKHLVEETRFPALVSLSEVARPARMSLSPGASVTLGREPGCEMWLGAPHVSRRHLTVAMSEDGVVTVRDTSTNGTAFSGGVLHRGDVLEITDEPHVLDFGSGVTVAICFDDDHEQAYVRAGGALSTFRAPAARPSLAIEEMRSKTSMHLTPPPPPPGMAGRLLALMNGLSWRDKLVIALAGAALTVLFAVVVSILLPIFR